MAEDCADDSADDSAKASAEDRVILGAAAHSISRSGVVGPVGVSPECQRSGVGAALMSRVLAELSVAGLQRAEIAWISTIGFYVATCGAEVSRTSQMYERRIVDQRGGDC